MMRDAYHRYFVCLSYADHPDPLRWNPWAEESDHVPRYFQRALREMDRCLQSGEGLTFYLTWNLDALPSYGPGVVAVVMGDEWGHVPAYAHRVLATFKCYGARPAPGVSLRTRPFHLGGLLALKTVRMYASYLPGALRYWWRHSRGASPIHPIPLGYGNQVALPVRAFSERSVDVFFAGSLKPGTVGEGGLGKWLHSPKDVSRREMVGVLRDLERRPGRPRVHIQTSERFVLNALEYGLTKPGEVLEGTQYSEAMMNAKICVVPRGTSPETFRFYEGLRYGCVLITERLPARRFYTGAPVIQLDDWRALPRVVDRLLDDPAELQRRHEAGLNWWRTHCSEEATGAFIAQEVERLRQALPSARVSHRPHRVSAEASAAPVLPEQVPATASPFSSPQERR